MDFTRRYVDLQQARFSDRLEVDYRIAEDCRHLGVPTFVLQPLVENAIRHGMGRQGRRCRLEVGARLERDELHLWVSDDGLGIPEDFELARDAGTGLGNTRSRLDRLYGRAALLHVAPRDGGGAIADIVIPARAMVEAEATA